MRKLFIAFTALAAVGIVTPIITGTAHADEKKVVIKKGDRGHHYGWRNHHHVKKVIIKKGDHDRDSN